MLKYNYVLTWKIMKLGIDLGGTKIEGILLDDDGNEFIRKRIATPSNNYSEIIKAVGNLVTDLSDAEPSAATIPIGIGIPGSISKATGLVKNANTTCLIGKALQKDLEVHLNRPIKLANDANCFTISEATDGSGKGHTVVFGVILGTGVGGGITFGSKLWEGPNLISGEWGHNPLPWPSPNDETVHYDIAAPECYCGKKRCIETFLSGPGFSNDYKLFSEEAKTPEDIIVAANDGNLVAIAAIQRYEARLAIALSSIINILDPDIIVLGGGLSNIGRLYENVPKLWMKWVFSDICETKLVKNGHGDASGVRGAAWLW